MKAWCQLLRIANLPSALANILMAFLVTHQQWSPTLELVGLLASSACFYLGGMVLNDVFDVEKDRLERPERPLPAGDIAWSSARQVGWGLLIAGFLLAGLTGGLATNQGQWNLRLDSPWMRCLLVGGSLFACIWLYDGPCKRMRLAPLLMGLCRFFNLLLGASTFTADQGYALLLDPVLGLPWLMISIAGAIGVIIAGVTWLARNEAVGAQRMPLAMASIVIVAGLVALAAIAYCPELVDRSQLATQRFPIMLAVISVTLVRRLVEAIVSTHSRQVQIAVVAVLRSLILFDASVCYLAVPGNPYYAVAVVSLLVPSLWLGRWVRST